MQLATYLKQKNETASEFCRRGKPPLSKSCVSRLLAGTRKPGAALMMQIVRMTGGKVGPADWKLKRASVPATIIHAEVAPPS